jgi:preprotein translocase subunit SecA
MAAREGRGDPGFYPERDARRDSALDRAAGTLAMRARLVFARALRPSAPLAGTVQRHAARLRAAPLMAQLPELRYRLRRDGLSGDRLAECFGAYAAALPAAADSPDAHALDAAAALVEGRIVDLADARSRWQALALAASAFALCGVPVHLYAASEARAQAAAEDLRGPLAALGLGVAVLAAGMSPAERRVAFGAAVTCGTHRVVGLDYLRDRLQLGRRLRPLQGRLERLSGDTTSSAGMLLLNGLHCALVEDADQVLIDDARVPLVVSADIESSRDRLPFEQALELARALQAGADYAAEEGGMQLTAHGAQQLAQLSVLLGGLWAARQRREELVRAALTALHGMQKGRDYQVAQGALQIARGEADGEEAPPESLQRLLEVKEGLAFAGRREVLARLTVPHFFRRYLRLAGTCADARGLEGEFWSYYGLRTSRAGWPPAEALCATRVFREPAQRRAALAAAVRERAARGHAVVVAVRSGAEAGAVAAALQEAEVPFGVLRGAPGEEERAALLALDHAGAVAISLFPAQRGSARVASLAAPLHLALADLHEARRHVAQIARAYAASSCEQFLALGDDGIPPRPARAGALDAALAPGAARRFAAAAQRGIERAAARQRGELLAREQALEDMLAFSGRPE